MTAVANGPSFGPLRTFLTVFVLNGPERGPLVADEALEGGVDPLDGESDDVVVGAVDAGDAGIADPFLDAVGAGFVEGFERVDVVGNLFVSEIFEPDVGGDGESLLYFDTSKCHGRYNLMLPSGKIP